LDYDYVLHIVNFAILYLSEFGILPAIKLILFLCLFTVLPAAQECFHLYGDVTVASGGLEILGLCLVLGAERYLYRARHFLRVCKGD
jgi:hypothetical protein